jgi:Tol biopolymer transport system component
MGFSDVTGGLSGIGAMSHALRSPRVRLRAALLVGLLAALVCTASPATATFPGRDGRIAFADFITGQIYAVNPDGTGLAQLTHTDARHVVFSPEWTADGRVTFSLLRANTLEDHARIWIMNADGTEQHKLAGDAPGYRDYGANLTPDGRRIVFARCKPDNGVCAIWIMRSDGTGKRPLTPYREGQNEAIDFFPTVSPDGRHVAFTRFAWKGIAAQVYEMRIDGSGEHAITPAALEATSPDYSPDGSLVVVHSQAVRLGSSIYSLHRDGTHVTKLTQTAYPNNDIDPAYSPRGDSIAFSSDRRYDDFCCADLFAMTEGGTEEHRVPTDGIQGVVQVAWGSAPLVTDAEAARFAPVTPAEPAASAGARSWCTSMPAIMRMRFC